MTTKRKFHGPGPIVSAKNEKVLQETLCQAQWVGGTALITEDPKKVTCAHCLAALKRGVSIRKQDPRAEAPPPRTPVATEPAMILECKHGILLEKCWHGCKVGHRALDLTVHHL